MASAWVAVAGPGDWKLGRWTKTSETTWEETKLDQSQAPSTFRVLMGGTVTPGSTTVRLQSTFQKSGDAPVEVLITDTTIQVFSDGQYLGEYLGSWEGATRSASKFAGVAPMQQSFVSSGAPGATQQMKVQTQTLRASSKPTGTDRSPAKVLNLVNAVTGGDIAAAKALLQEGVDPNAKAQGKTPLLIAASKGSMPMVEVLLEFGADPNVPGQDNTTPLSVAFQAGHKAVLSKLFGSTFHSLENLVPRDDGSINFMDTGDDSMPANATENLREVTMKLSKLSPAPAPGRRMSNELQESVNLDPMVMREQALKDKMHTLAAHSPRPQH